METKIAYESDNPQQIIRGTVIRPKSSKELSPAVLLIHGMTSNEKNYVLLGRLLAQKGFICLAINLRGHGEEGNESDGSRNELRIADGIQDGLSAYDYLIGISGVDTSRIGIVGASYGATIASLLVAQRSVKSLVLRVPATYSPEMMEMTDEEIVQEEEDFFNEMTKDEILQTPPIKALQEFTGNLLVISSENDAIIPPVMTEAFFEVAKKAKVRDWVVIKGATHNLSDDMWRKEFWDKTVNFLSENV